MKVAVLGGAGAMARTIVKDLSENSAVTDILVADYRENEAKAYARSFNDSRITGVFMDANAIDQTAGMLKEYDVLVNSAQHFVNIPAMKACLQAKCHYTDLGGLFHVTLEQLKLFGEFKKAGLTAVICMGSAPGITNVLARHAYDNLDTVEKVVLSDGIHDMTDMSGIDVFIPPYSIRTVMAEFTDTAVMYKDGKFVEVSPLTGVLTVNFPEPIGKRKCIQTLHSEPATIPTSFEDKGIREVTWCLSLPPELEAKSRFLASLGFGHNAPIQVGGIKVGPLDVIVSVIDKQVKDKCSDVQFEINDMECLRAHVIGTKNGEVVEYVNDCLVRTHSRWGCSSGDVCTGVPPSIIAQWLADKTLNKPGVWAPEQIIEPLPFFKQLNMREMEVSISTKKHIG